jgi:formamidopyrimidine-DNA glycosylase
VPELPEIEVLRRSLEPRLVGRRIRRVEVRSPALREPFDRRRLRRELEGRTIRRLGRRGKYLLIEVDEGRTLVVHLGMSGRLTLVPRSRAGEPHEHLVVGLDRGEELRLRDPRRFGLAFVVATRGLARDRHLAHLGREPLEPRLTGADLVELARGLKAPVKPFLMDATKLVGVGNIYATEALFRAGIHPFRSVARIGRERWELLAAAVVAVLEDAIRQGGTTLNDFRDGAGNAGEFQVDLAVYGREDLPCPRCGTLIRRRVRSNRSAFYCPACQR